MTPNKMTILIVLFFVFIPAISEADVYKPYMSYSDSGKGIDDTEINVVYCDDMHIGVTVVGQGAIACDCPDSELDIRFTRYKEQFIPHQITPYMPLGFSPPDESWGLVGTWTNEQIYQYCELHNLSGWFNTLRKRIDETWHDQITPPLRRYRILNEWNVFGPKDEEGYLELCREVYFPFREQMHPDATIVISLASGDNACSYLRKLLTRYKELYFHPGFPDHEDLPFDGLDLHCRNYDYMHCVKVYREMEATFNDVFEGCADAPQFSDMVIWFAETADIPNGNCTTELGLSYEYISDNDMVRHDVKTICQALSLPNVLMINLDKRKDGDWDKKIKDGIYDLYGLINDGFGLWDRGDGVAKFSKDLLRKFALYTYDYRPLPNTVMDEVRVFDWVKNDVNHRYVLWKDYGIGETQKTLQLPSTWRTAWVINLVTNEEEYHRLGLPLITVSVGEDPLLITPSRYLDRDPELYVISDVRSSITSEEIWGDGAWTSVLNLANPMDSMVTLVIEAYGEDGDVVGATYETELTSHEVLRMDLIDIWPAFRGPLKIMASDCINGFLEYTHTGTSGKSGNIVPIQNVKLNNVISDTAYYLTQDWETGWDANGYPFMNEMILVNPESSQSTVSLSIFDHTGQLNQTESLALQPFAQYRTLLNPEQNPAGYGKLECVSAEPLVGQLSRFYGYRTGRDRAWSEEKFISDYFLTDKIKSEIRFDDESVSNITVTNPWIEPIEGTVSEYDTDGDKISESEIQIPADGTYKLTADSTEPRSIEITLTENAKAFGRVESKASADGNDVWISDVKSNDENPETCLVLPYFKINRSPENLAQTRLIITNHSGIEVSASIRCYGMNGDLTNETDYPVEFLPDIKTEISLMDIIPLEISEYEGYLEVIIPQFSGISGMAIYTTMDPETESSYSMSVSLSESDVVR